MNAGSAMSLGRRVLGLVAWVTLSFSPGLTAVFVSPGGWYAKLHKPVWNPPSWLFGPVWSLLYLCMGVAAWLVWQRGGWRGQKVPLGLFLVQLALNALWTPLFFGLHQPGWAFIEILALLLVLSATFGCFFRAYRVAGWLLIPYLAWTTFAAALNLANWRLNS